MPNTNQFPFPKLTQIFEASHRKSAAHERSPVVRPAHDVEEPLLRALQPGDVDELGDAAGEVDGRLDGQPALQRLRRGPFTCDVRNFLGL